MTTNTARTRRLAPGVYETPEGHRIQRGYSEGRDRQPVLNGWDLIGPEGDWWDRYATKADALASLDEATR
jgi:hypothetical protein